MPRKLSVGPSSLPSAVWLYTTSRMISMPASCIRETIVLNSPKSGRDRYRGDGAKNEIGL